MVSECLKTRDSRIREQDLQASMQNRDSILETERTVVNRITLDDAAFFVELLNSKGYLNYIGDRGVSDLASSRRYIRNKLLSSYAEHDFGYYLVNLKSGIAPIGICGFLKKPILDNPDFGFAFLPAYGNQGLGYESAVAVFQYGIDKFEFSVIDALTREDNARSISLLSKLGFRRVGTSNSFPEEEVQVDLYRWIEETVDEA